MDLYTNYQSSDKSLNSGFIDLIKLNFFLVVLVAMLAFSSCNKTETYADQLERETEAINSFIVKKHINVISEEQFAKQGFTIH